MYSTANAVVTLLMSLFLLTVTSCGPERSRLDTANDSTVVNLTTPADQLGENDSEATYNEYEDMYALIVDQTDDYSVLQSSMYTIAAATGLPIDTMDRVYDENTRSLRLRDTADMPVEYLPWRGDGRNLSIEYGDFYDTTIASGQMILLGGLYRTPESADTVLQLVLPHAPKAIVKPCRIFMGCML
jgi:hypothetical protein